MQIASKFDKMKLKVRSNLWTDCHETSRVFPTAPRKSLNRQYQALANTRQNDARPPVSGWRDAGRPHAAQQVLCYILQQGGVWAKSVAGS